MRALGHGWQHWARTTGVALSLSVAILSGCEKKAPPPPPPPPPPPVEEPEPEPVRINLTELRTELDIDPRVELDADMAPYDRSLAAAVLQFSEALVDGDDAAFAKHLADLHEPQLDALLADDTWLEATESLEGITVVDLAQRPSTAERADTATVLMALQERGTAYLMGWELERDGNAWKARAVPVTPEERPGAEDWAGFTLAQARAGAAASGSANSGKDGAFSFASLFSGAAPGDIDWSDVPPGELVNMYVVFQAAINLSGESDVRSFLQKQMTEAAQQEAQDAADGDPTDPAAQAFAGAAEAMVAALVDGLATAFQALLDAGKAARDAGTEPNYAELNAFLQDPEENLGPMAGQVTPDQLIDEIANVLGITPAELREKLTGGGGSEGSGGGSSSGG